MLPLGEVWRQEEEHPVGGAKCVRLYSSVTRDRECMAESSPLCGVRVHGPGMVQLVKSHDYSNSMCM